MANDMHKDGWKGYGDIAVRIGDRDYRSKDLRDLSAAYSPQALDAALHDFFGTVSDMENAKAQLKRDAKAIAENLNLPDAMALLQEIGMVVHKAAQR